MAVFIHPYRPEIIDRLRAVAESKIDEMKANRGLPAAQQYAAAADADPLVDKSGVFPENMPIEKPEFSYSIYVDLMPVCKRATDIKFFDTLDELITGSTTEIAISMHFSRSRHAEKHILKMNGVSQSTAVKNEKSLEGLVPASDIEKIKSETADQVRQQMQFEWQRQENKLLREQLEEIQNQPAEDPSGLNKLLMTAGVAAIEKWKRGDFDKSGGTKLSKEHAFLLGLGERIVGNFQDKQHLDKLLDILSCLAKRKHLMPLLLEMLRQEPTDAELKKTSASQQQGFPPEQQESSEDSQQQDDPQQDESEDEQKPAPPNEDFDPSELL